MTDSKAQVAFKTQDLADKAKLVIGEEVRITTEGQRHLGASLDPRNTKTNNVVEKWRMEGKHRVAG